MTRPRLILPSGRLLLAAMLGCVCAAEPFDPTSALLEPLPGKAEAAKPKRAVPPPSSAPVKDLSKVEAPKPAASAETRAPSKPAKVVSDRFNLAVNNAAASQLYLAMVQGTRYEMLLPPSFPGTVSANLRNVTVEEALAVLKEIYGYDYRIDGDRIVMQPLSMQTRIYTLNYLNTTRRGTSDTRVMSGSVNDVGNSASGNAPANASGGNNSPAPSGGSALETSKIQTQSSNDLWVELKASLESLVGKNEGRNVTLSPNTGIVIVRAMPDEHAQVAAFLKAAQLSIERQVILEAKILEVALSDGYRKGINWAAFGSLASSPATRISIGSLAPGSTASAEKGILGGIVSGDASNTLANNGANSLLGVVFRADNFSAVINLLEQQGTVNVLSSPRIATLNNQKAVLKVGTDDFFVTNVSTTTTNNGTSSTTSPTLTLRPFFSGISLDVTPQIDDQRNVILHVRPSVSDVRTVDKRIDLGSGGTYNLPLASSRVSETDSVVRAENGQIVAIGGLMRRSSSKDRDDVPGLSKLPVVGGLFSSETRSTELRELVFLLKPIVVESSASWQPQVDAAQQKIDAIEDGLRTIKLP